MKLETYECIKNLTETEINNLKEKLISKDIELNSIKEQLKISDI